MRPSDDLYTGGGVDDDCGHVVLTNPNEDSSPEAFRAFINVLLTGPESELDNVDAVQARRSP